MKRFQVRLPHMALLVVVAGLLSWHARFFRDLWLEDRAPYRVVVFDSAGKPQLTRDLGGMAGRLQKVEGPWRRPLATRG
jgi:hypothetical protein